MARYELLAGMHIQADRTKPVLDAEGNPTGRFASRKYTKGQTVESDTDLVALHGPQKFKLLGGGDSDDARRVRELEAELAQMKARAAASVAAGGFRTQGDPTPENLINNPATFPGGQVSTGWQGGAPAEAAEALQASKQAAAGQQAPKKGQPAKGYTEAQLHAMTVQDLREYAAEEEIDLKGAHTKEEIVKAIRGGK